MNDMDQWARFKKYYVDCKAVGVALDISRMNFTGIFLDEMAPRMQKAYADMKALEGGAIANPDEKRMVGHYWLRDSSKAPNKEIKDEIDTCLANIKKFAKAVHEGTIKPQKAKLFKNLLVIGIGGSALGPQFVAKGLASATDDKLKPYFFDNTDPDGMDYVLQQIGTGLKETIAIVVSKSGATAETRSGMLEAEALYRAAGLNFGQHAVAITQAGSKLDAYAEKNGFLARFPMWDWVGGRTSELSAVGLLPAAVQGLDIQGMLDGAKKMDVATRIEETRKNPAALLALMWLHAQKGTHSKDMVILPYKDRLELFSRYLQQLVMESLGKEKDLDGAIVNQGIAVYGNKGSTDQHAYVQQLRDGANEFFVTFIEVLKDREGPSIEVEPGATSGDFLNGFHQGTRKALSDNRRENITITIPDASAESIGKLIALYERAVGFYASLVNINAYNQPGVEAGKKAAEAVLKVQREVLAFLNTNKGKWFTVEQIAEPEPPSHELPVETTFKTLLHLAANGRVKIKAGKTVFEALYSA